MKWWDKFVGKSALSRAERLIADKHDEISRARKIQLDEVLAIQKQIDEVETEIVGLRKKRQRLQAKSQAAITVNLERLKQLEAELQELIENEKVLQQPGKIAVPAGKTLEFTTMERDT